MPELMVSNIERSLSFWTGLCGVEIRYQRTEHGFAFLDREGAQFMLEEVRGDDGWGSFWCKTRTAICCGSPNG